VEILFHPDAVEEAAAARQWYADRSTVAATAFDAELDRGVDSLREAPLRWPPDSKDVRRLLLRRFPFALIYRIKLDQVLAVAHLHSPPGLLAGSDREVERAAFQW
tara:strand:- start:703 stop:1017 length:315 start_codon:yes stop_codon:yes gene_type:complete